MAPLERTDDVVDGDDAVPRLPELVELLEERNAEMDAHGARGGAHAERIARAIGPPAPAIGRVRVAARLHDLGKIWIPRDILDKPGALTDAEWSQVRRHPQVAERLLRQADLHDLADIVLAHHERPDAAGYPNGIPSCDAPLE